ncbi:MAG: TrbC/VirB2 family protein [Clostridium sp.]|jgi:nitric oxide reductase large subunit|nr:TrbC/VirB2 family protein [Clostridium sp.]MEE0126781.1 TrbC/VirB2 family protein [Clostridia bacterium]
MKKRIVKILTIILMVVALVNITNFVYADDINTEDFAGIYTKDGVSDLDNKTGKILSIVQIAGTAISLVALLILGMKYMLSSPDDKATIKEKLVPYVIGVIIFFAASNLVTIVLKFAMGMPKG